MDKILLQQFVMKKQSYIYLIAAEVDMGSIKKGHLGAQFYDLIDRHLWYTVVLTEHLL